MFGVAVTSILNLQKHYFKGYREYGQDCREMMSLITKWGAQLDTEIQVREIYHAKKLEEKDTMVDAVGAMTEANVKVSTITVVDKEDKTKASY